MADLVGVSNLNVDRLVFVDDKILEETGLDKGNDHGKTEFDILEEKIRNYKIETKLGGCVANSIAGAHSLGIDCFLSGITGNDELGEFYKQDLERTGLKHRITVKKGRTSQIICLITPDKQRTFVSDMGVADSYAREDVPFDQIRPGTIFHTSGYELEGPGLAAVVDCIHQANRIGAKVAFDFGSAGAVDRGRRFLNALVKDSVDILFCNDYEAEKFTGQKPEEAVNTIGKMCEIAVVTIGPKGALIKSKGKKYHVPSYPAKAVDTTGAGDAFRAGFFYGLIKTKDIEKAGRMGCYYASKVIECIGARLSEKITGIEKRI